MRIQLICLAIAVFAAQWFASAGDAADSEVDLLFAQLLTADTETAQQIELRILEIWSDSGSPSMNLLLQRGRRAIAQRRHRAAIDHLTALTDHAPQFAEGWNARATAWFMMGRYELSMADIERTLALNDRHFGAMAGMAMILERRGLNEEALSVLLVVEGIHPNRQGIGEWIRRLESKTRKNLI